MVNKLEDALIRALAKKKGIPEAEANVYIEALQEELGGEDGLQKWMATLTANADVLTKMPVDVQKDLIGLMAARIGNNGGGKKESSDDLAVRIAAVREAFKDDVPGPTTDPELKEKLDSLMATIEAMKEEKAKKELEDLKTGIDTRLQSIEEKLQAGGAPGEVGDEIDKMAKDAEKLAVKQTKLKELLGVKDQPAEVTLSTESARKHLETLGYQVNGPKTVAELEKEFTGKLDKAFKDAKEEAKKEMRAEERKLEILADIGGSIIETVIPVLGKGGGQKALSATAAALKSAAAAGA